VWIAADREQDASILPDYIRAQDLVLDSAEQPAVDSLISLLLMVKTALRLLYVWT